MLCGAILFSKQRIRAVKAQAVGRVHLAAPVKVNDENQVELTASKPCDSDNNANIEINERNSPQRIKSKRRTRRRAAEKLCRSLNASFPTK